MTRQELINNNKLMINSKDAEIVQLFVYLLSYNKTLKKGSIQKFRLTLDIFFSDNRKEIVLVIRDTETKIELITFNTIYTYLLHGLRQVLIEFINKFGLGIQAADIIFKIPIPPYLDFVSLNLEINITTKVGVKLTEVIVNNNNIDA